MFPLHDDNPTKTVAFFTVTFIAMAVGVFLWQFTRNELEQSQILLGLGFIPAALLGAQDNAATLPTITPWLTLFSSMFLHGGWMHLLGNMLFLWIFGNNVEESMGHVRFVVFYLLCGVVAALSQAYGNPESTIPMVGASGAISGVLGAYLLLYPHARILTLIVLGFFIRTIYLPAMVVLGLWFVLQLVNSWLSSGAQGGVAWGAHIGGFVAGMVFIPLFKNKDHRLFSPPRIPPR